MTYTKIDVMRDLAIGWDDRRALNWTVLVGCSESAKKQDSICMVARLEACWANEISGRGFNQITFMPGHLNDPMSRKKSAVILVAWRSEIAEAPQHVLEKIIGIIKQCPHHAFVALTKKADLLGKKLEKFRGDPSFPVNFHIGVSMNVQGELYRARDLELHLGGLGAWFWFVEPALGKWQYAAVHHVLERCPHVRWVAIGGWSDLTDDRIVKKAPVLDTSVVAIAQAAKDCRVPVALKENLSLQLRERYRNEYPPTPAYLGGTRVQQRMFA